MGPNYTSLSSNYKVTGQVIGTYPPAGVDTTEALYVEGPVGMIRPDGYQMPQDSALSFQGVRVRGDGTGQWLTPDMYRGTVGNPLSQRAYAWVGNNPLANSDPSGFVTSCPGGTLNEGGGVCSPAGGSSTLFPGPFGGGGGGTASFGPTIIRRQAAACPPGGAKTAATIGLSGAGSIIVIGVGANLSANLQLNVAGANSNISLSLQAAGGLGGGAYVGAGGGLVGGIGGSVPAPGFSTDYGSYLEGDAGWGPSGSFSTSQSASSTSLQVSPPWFGPLSRLGVGAGAGAGAFGGDGKSSGYAAVTLASPTLCQILGD